MRYCHLSIQYITHQLNHNNDTSERLGSCLQILSSISDVIGHRLRTPGLRSKDSWAPVSGLSLWEGHDGV